MCHPAIEQSKKTYFTMQLSLLIFFLLQLPARHYPSFHPDLIDGVRGLFLGIVLGCFFLIAKKNRGTMA